MTLSRAAGFTLLETMAALVVVGLIIVLLAHSVDFVLSAWQRQGLALTVHDEMEPIERTLRRLIEQTDPGDPGWPPAFEGDAHRLLFATEMLDVLAGEAEVALGMDNSHQLVLLWHSRLARPEVQHSAVLLEGVERLDIQYWEPETSTWLNTWSLHSLPGLVRLRVVFPRGDPRHLPDVIAAPMRARHYG